MKNYIPAFDLSLNIILVFHMTFFIVQCKPSQAILWNKINNIDYSNRIQFSHVQNFNKEMLCFIVIKHNCIRALIMPQSVSIATEVLFYIIIYNVYLLVIEPHLTICWKIKSCYKNHNCQKNIQLRLKLYKIKIKVNYYKRINLKQ